MVEFSEVINKFANDIYNQCCKQSVGQNVILSPLSIQTAISLALMGAKGKTAEEIKSVLHLGDIAHEEIASNFKSLMENLNAGSSVKVANKIYVQENYAVKLEFNDLATKNFYSEAENVNFSDNEVTAKNINQWVESKTNNKIRDLIDPSVLDGLTRMVLVNAIYFKGLWQNQFKLEDTKDLPFYVNETDSVDVPMMYHKKKYNYGVFKELDATGLEMKYKDSDISMFILLPNSRTGLAALEEKLQNVNLKDLSKKMGNFDVHVTLPRFKVEYSLSLKDVLTKVCSVFQFTEYSIFSYYIIYRWVLKLCSLIMLIFQIYWTPLNL